MLNFQPSPYSNVLWPTPDGQAPGVVTDAYGAWTDYVPGAGYVQSAARGAQAAVSGAARGAVSTGVRAAQEYLPESLKSGLGVGTSADFYSKNPDAIAANSAQPATVDDAYAKAIWWVQLARNRADYDGKKAAAEALYNLGGRLTSERAASTGIWLFFDPRALFARHLFISTLYTRVADEIARSGISPFDATQISGRLRTAASRARTGEVASTVTAVAALGALGYLGYRVYRRTKT